MIAARVPHRERVAGARCEIRKVLLSTIDDRSARGQGGRTLYVVNTGGHHHLSDARAAPIVQPDLVLQENKQTKHAVRLPPWGSEGAGGALWPGRRELAGRLCSAHHRWCISRMLRLPHLKRHGGAGRNGSATLTTGLMTAGPLSAVAGCSHAWAPLAGGCYHRATHRVAEWLDGSVAAQARGGQRSSRTACQASRGEAAAADRHLAHRGWAAPPPLSETTCTGCRAPAARACWPAGRTRAGGNGAAAAGGAGRKARCGSRGHHCRRVLLPASCMRLVRMHGH